MYKRKMNKKFHQNHMKSYKNRSKWKGRKWNVNRELNIIYTTTGVCKRRQLCNVGVSCVHEKHLFDTSHKLQQTKREIKRKIEHWFCVPFKRNSWMRTHLMVNVHHVTVLHTTFCLFVFLALLSYHASSLDFCTYIRNYKL